tara:strand:- start:255 stop:461 length:207 start_codon:yes stop_codon:yes gene_type:complete
MKKSDLRQIIKEEISKLNESRSLPLTTEEASKLKYILKMKLKYYEETGDEFFEDEIILVTNILNKLTK